MAVAKLQVVAKNEKTGHANKNIKQINKHIYPVHRMHYYNMAHNHLIVAISNHSILGTWTLMSIAYLISLRLQVP